MAPLTKWLGDIPWVVLVPLAVLMALAPFGATPHLVEKWRMLFAGTLRRPLDWFDLVLHTAPLLLILAKLVAMLQKRAS